jgi:hypothetical protein
MIPASGCAEKRNTSSLQPTCIMAMLAATLTDKDVGKGCGVNPGIAIEKTEATICDQHKENW